VSAGEKSSSIAPTDTNPSSSDRTSIARAPPRLSNTAANSGHTM
jgi:hypothetical protein